MKRVLDGWLRPVLAAYADNMQRFLPSEPTAKSLNRICDNVTRNCRNGSSSG